MAKELRTFVRGLDSATYGLTEFRQKQLSYDRVRNDEYVVDDARLGRSGSSGQSKSTGMFMGLIQHGRSGPIDRPDEFGPREMWGHFRAPGVKDCEKVLGDVPEYTSARELAKSPA